MRALKLSLLVLTVAAFVAASPASALDTVEIELESSAALGPRVGVAVENLLGSVRLVGASKPGAVHVDARVVAEAKTPEEARALADSIRIERATEGRDVRFRVVFPVEQEASFRPPKAGVKGLISRWTAPMFQQATSAEYGGRTVLLGGDRKASGLAVHLTVTVPYDHSITVRQPVGSVEGRALRGDLHVETVDGDVAFERCFGTLDVTAERGQLTVAGFQGKSLRLDLAAVRTELSDVRVDALHLANDSGSIRGARVVTNDLVVDNGTGEVQLGVESRTVRATADAGLLDLATNMTTLRSAEMRSEAGDVVLRVGDLSHFDLAAESQSGTVKVLGEVQLDLVAQEGTLQRFKHGQGGPDVQLAAPAGIVTVRPYEGSRLNLMVNGHPR